MKNENPKNINKNKNCKPNNHKTNAKYSFPSHTSCSYFMLSWSHYFLSVLSAIKQTTSHINSQTNRNPMLILEIISSLCTKKLWEKSDKPEYQ